MKPQFDEKGLIPVILQDFQTNQVLMLGYMDREAWQKTLEEKKVYFYSRSKERLWLKGETSGNYQEAVAIHLDCDRDTALIKVKSKGPACHTGNHSCFFNPILTPSKPHPFTNFWEELFQVIQQRKKNPRKSSYTSQLLSQGKEKICQKLGEEATELIVACFGNDKEHIIHEIADLIYHLLVLISYFDLDLKHISDELSTRRK